MPLLALWKANPKAIKEMTIEQVVTTAGDGRLRDKSDCSRELREYLSQVQSDSLAHYAEYCLSSAFNRGGMVLQDLVNEMGRDSISKSRTVDTREQPEKSDLMACGRLPKVMM